MDFAALRKMAREGTSRERAEAARELAPCDDPGAVPLLRRLAFYDPEPSVRYEARAGFEARRPAGTRAGCP
ncbi:MAG: hypothetical protein HY814_08105 [Candidatus Riflebacteria bacterium]|nr:hypothetical protein [Candidatus Riflebacteria bacterium]